MVVSAQPDPSRGQVGAVLAEALTAAISGSGRLLLLSGEAGIGKTTTARDVTTAARRGGVTVRWSACSSTGGTVAHGPWFTLLSGLGPPGRRAMGVLQGTSFGDRTATTAARTAAYNAVVTALEEASTRRAVLLVLDDLHWADEGTLQLLDVVAAHVPGLPVLVVGAYRDTDTSADSMLTRLGGRADRLPLRGLDRSAVAALLGEQVGAGRGAVFADEVLGLTGGNPFLVVQIGRLLAEDEGALGVGTLPTGARDLLQQGLAPLDASDRAVLVAAAVLGSPFRTADLDHMLDLPSGALNAALDRAASLRIVGRSPGTGSWAFTHDLLRLAALEGVDSSDIADLHKLASTVLRVGDAEPAVIAAHLLAAGPPCAVEAAEWSVSAGDRALSAMAWEEAAAHYERALLALRPGTPDSDSAADALAGLGRARLFAGDEEGAARAFADLASIGRSLGSARLLARAALGFSADLSGFEVRLFDQRQIDLLEEAANALEATPEPGLRATVLARLSVALSFTAPDVRRLELAEKAVVLAREAADPIVLGRALGSHCDAIAGPQHVDQRRAEASEIIAIAEEAGDGPLELLGRRLRFVAALERGDIAGVEEDTRAFARRAATVGSPLYSWYVPLWRAQFSLVGGDLSAADRLIGEAEALGRAAGSTNGPMLAAVLRLSAMWQSGDNTGAVRAVEALVEEGSPLEMYIAAPGEYAWAYYLVNRLVDAAACLDRAAAIGLDAHVADAEWLPNIANVVRVAAAIDHPVLGNALALLEPYADLVAFEGIGAGLYGSVARFVAVGCSALGRHDDAVRYAEQAVVVNRGFGGSLTADALRSLAECLIARGDDAALAESRHTDADAAYAAIGLSHLVRSHAQPATGGTRSGTANEFRRGGDVWHITYGGISTIIKHTKGMADLAVLLSAAGREVHVSDLEGVPVEVFGDSGDAALDRRAIAAYKARLADLSEELDDADADHDIARADRARAEYDAIVDQLTGAIGAGGRSRAAGPVPIERLRKAVSARVHDAIRRIEIAHPALGRHLANAVRTGIYCSYQPEVATGWRR